MKMDIQEVIKRMATDTIMTYNETLGPAMKITNQEEANRYYEALVQRHIKRDECGRTEAENIVKSNLGYYAGCYDRETFERVNKLFNTAHPIFGKDYPTPEEAFNAGKRAKKEAGHKV